MRPVKAKCGQGIPKATQPRPVTSGGRAHVMLVGRSDPRRWSFAKVALADASEDSRWPRPASLTGITQSTPIERAIVDARNPSGSLVENSTPERTLIIGPLSTVDPLVIKPTSSANLAPERKTVEP
jgi:hypothetical protein